MKTRSLNTKLMGRVLTRCVLNGGGGAAQGWKRTSPGAMEPQAAELSAFDPALPEDGALIVAEVLRSQLNALNAEVQTRATTTELAQVESNLNAAVQMRVTYNDLTAAVQNTANNPYNLSPLSIGISDPPTQGEVQQMVYFMNELLAVLKRMP